MLEATAAVALILLIGREFLALGFGNGARLGARLAGWGALPFLLAFAVLVTVRIASYLSAPGS